MGSEYSRTQVWVQPGYDIWSMHTIQALSFLKLAHASLTHHCQVSQEILTSYSILSWLGAGGLAGLSLGTVHCRHVCHRKHPGRLTDES